MTVLTNADMRCPDTPPLCRTHPSNVSLVCTATRHIYRLRLPGYVPSPSDTIKATNPLSFHVYISL